MTHITATLDERVDELLQELENTVALDMQKRLSQHSSNISPKNAHHKAKTAIKQAVYAALVEQWPKKKRQPRQGGSICQDWLIGHNQAIDEALSVLSAVLGIGQDK